MPQQGSSKTVVTAASFVINIPILGGALGFSELNGINSKVEPTEYLESAGREGGVLHTKQFGKTVPPTISLKRGLDADGNMKLLAWHNLARTGATNARSSGTMDVVDSTNKPVISYVITDAWCQELIISGVKAGDSAYSTIEVKIACTEISAAK